MELKIGNRLVGDGHPVYIIAEVGINHNGDIGIAKRLIDVAVESHCDAVKFQKRTPELCVPETQKGIMRETPWGIMSYMEYRQKLEFGRGEYEEIDRYCKERGIQWFASSWDLKSLEFMETFHPPCHKVSSALLTNSDFLRACVATGRPIILSTGMSTMEQIRTAVNLLNKDNLLIAHCTSTYPSPLTQLNLRMISELEKTFKSLVGYSGHEVGLSPSYAAVILGAKSIERHITLDRAMWGSDQAASVEPGGLKRLVDNIRDLEIALGDGVKKIYDEELVAMRRLRMAPEIEKIMKE